MFDIVAVDDLAEMRQPGENAGNMDVVVYLLEGDNTDMVVVVLANVDRIAAEMVNLDIGRGCTDTVVGYVEETGSGSRVVVFEGGLAHTKREDRPMGSS